MLDYRSLLDEDYLYAYLYNSKGYHTTALKINNTIEQLASLIIKTASCPRIIVTDVEDNFILDTVNGQVNTCFNEYFSNKFLFPVLISMQTGITKPANVEILDWGSVGNNNNPQIMIPFIKENFGIEF
jgi:hypothetical protein